MIVASRKNLFEDLSFTYELRKVEEMLHLICVEQLDVKACVVNFFEMCRLITEFIAYNALISFVQNTYILTLQYWSFVVNFEGKNFLHFL